jgi:hypothetical protein
LRGRCLNPAYLGSEKGPGWPSCAEKREGAIGSLATLASGCRPSHPRSLHHGSRLPAMFSWGAASRRNVIDSRAKRWLGHAPLRPYCGSSTVGLPRTLAKQAGRAARSCSPLNKLEPAAPAALAGRRIGRRRSRRQSQRKSLKTAKRPASTTSSGSTTTGAANWRSSPAQPHAGRR